MTKGRKPMSLTKLRRDINLLEIELIRLMMELPSLTHGVDRRGCKAEIKNLRRKILYRKARLEEA